MSNKVDILINGRNYAINCPDGEEPALERASNYINHFIQEVRRYSPQLPHEELLVLCALTLFEQTESLKNHQETENQANEMIEKMVQDIKNLV
ncbi:cell division protein ZapA [Faucicola mancuniensis]|uniref:cell division protein ZapA n=1 Tax=Faucicola mancuniensis TaxID=1309795 RepID=UPI0028E974F7|nr:cell division protein ZapA [uncultured Moraxella sp.]